MIIMREKMINKFAFYKSETVCNFLRNTKISYNGVFRALFTMFYSILAWKMRESC